MINHQLVPSCATIYVSFHMLTNLTHATGTINLFTLILLGPLAKSMPLFPSWIGMLNALPRSSAKVSYRISGRLPDPIRFSFWCLSSQGNTSHIDACSVHWLIVSETPEINLLGQHAWGGGLIWTVRKLEAIVAFSMSEVKCLFFVGFTLLFICTGLCDSSVAL